MVHQKISSIRRAELIQAAMKSIYEHGFADLTVAQIAKDAEASTGSIHYYFGGKDALLEATMRHLLSRLNAAHQRRLQKAKGPADRLHAVVQANFDETFLTQETSRVWTQFWAFAPYHAKLGRLHRINRARVRSNIVYSLRQFLPVQDIGVTTNAIQGYMDGVWVQLSQAKIGLDLNQVQCEARRAVDRIIGKLER